MRMAQGQIRPVLAGCAHGLGRYLSDPDRKKADRAMQAMMKMQKIVIADLDKAYAG
jgi:hypothetical protein